MQAAGILQLKVTRLGTFMRSNGQGFLVAAVVAFAAQFLSEH